MTEVLATLEGSQVITRIIIETDEEHSAQVARLVSGVIGSIEQQLNRVYGEVEAVRLWR
ncbi:hypothetical protein [Gynuella sp.]|uniref:hypothetical protein n=1 Tax=Gynuella sp. TaxID=2969146 RepID=UPI003D129EA9